MIKSNGLRIGNYLDFGSRICIIEAIDKQGVEVKFLDNGEEEWIDLYLFTPIPITKEILLKCGFSKFKGDNSDCFLNDFETSCNMELLFWKGTEIKNIKHLHQLQNLYFALTGKEIEIKF